MKRHCGDCRLCCKLMYIGEKGTIDGEPYEFVHYPGSWCKHAILQPGERGCALHGTKRKPFACTSFRCLWLMGEGRDEDRPDKIKVVVSIEPRSTGGSAEEVASGPPETYLVVYEGAPGATATQKAASFMDHVAWVYKTTDDVRGLEIVPFGKPWEDRLVAHKDKGTHHIRLCGWPPLLDVDDERTELESVFGPGAWERDPNELFMELKNMPPERKAEALRIFESHVAMQIGGRSTK